MFRTGQFRRGRSVVPYNVHSGDLDISLLASVVLRRAAAEDCHLSLFMRLLAVFSPFMTTLASRKVQDAEVAISAAHSPATIEQTTGI